MEFFITCNGIPVHVSDSQNGDTVVLFLHGYLETLYIWDEFLPLFQSSVRTVAIDLPGHGLSGTHPESNSMQFCSDAILSLLDHLKIDKCHIVGHSMGGYIGQTFIRLHPERSLSLTNLNSNPFADLPEKRSDRLKEIEFIEQGRLLSLCSLAIPNMYSKANLRKFDSKIIETLEICETHDPQGVAATVRGLMERPDNVEFLKNTNIPVQFIFGDSDNYITPEKIQNISELLPNSKCVTIPETGHNSFIENPALTFERLQFILL